MQQLIVISRLSPWCTIIKKDTGVTIGDVCSAIYKEYDIPSFTALYYCSSHFYSYSYTDHDITDAEFGSLNQRMQEQIKRTAAANFQQMQPPTQGGWGGYYPSAGPDRLRRVDWLRERVYFEGLVKDDNYGQGRLGFKAPNIFVMDLVS